MQPGVKVRGREYLRIIYGPEYDAPEHLVRLRVRNVHGKRRLALREFALGVESRVDDTVEQNTDVLAVTEGFSVDGK